VRIISGKYRGKHLSPGKDFKARPTTDFAKESLFNILANRYNFEEIKVLDLFSGTGSISFEFASRGCSIVEAVELNSKHAAFIIKTAKELNLSQIKLYKINAYQYLKFNKHKFDVIFADPPYDMVGVDLLPDLVLEKDILAKDGVFILEHSQNIDFAKHQRLTEHRNYGSVNFSFFS
jgi:16S rRNA (guanine(966)-N(2))-methyltransferase RsmD